jgi:hypothetical protein
VREGVCVCERECVYKCVRECVCERVRMCVCVIDNVILQILEMMTIRNVHDD